MNLDGIKYLERTEISDNNEVKLKDGRGYSKSEQVYMDFLKREFRDAVSIKKPTKGLFEAAQDKFEKTNSIVIMQK